MDNFKLFMNVKLSMDMCNDYQSIMYIIHEFPLISINNVVHYPWIILLFYRIHQIRQKI